MPEPLGDGAFQVRLGASADEETRRRIAAAALRVRGAGLPGVTECVPGFTTLTVHYDPLRLPAGPAPLEQLTSALRALLRDLPAPAGEDGRLVEIPVRYGGEDGADLAELAASHGMTPDQVVRLHAAPEYRVHLLGFIPGFPYLAGLDPRLATARRQVPRTAVPAGSVGIGGAQTGVYPLESPGGWHLIGRTPLRLFDPALDPPALLRPGDRVRFRPVEEGDAHPSRAEP